MSNNQQEHIGFIWSIANLLRGPYRPPQYRRVMLPMTVLRRLDCVLEPTREAVLKEYARLKGQPEKYVSARLNKISGYQFHNTSRYTFRKLLGEPENIAKNLLDHIRGFSGQARRIFEFYKFEQEIEKLDDSNRLFLIVQEFAKVDFHPDQVSNVAMGAIFEELVRKFNEQANEEAGDHFTPREVIRLMVHLLYDTEDNLFNTRGLIRTLYDPTCGTGGMLSVSEEYLKEHAPGAHLELFGQEYNEESWAICCSDMLIKGEATENIIFGDTLGDGKTRDGHLEKKFHYMLANPPFGVEWKPEKDVVTGEHEELGFDGRFGPGLPRINDGSMLFLLHMISKMHPAPEQGGEGSRIGIVFNGSPLFTGDAGSGESNIRKWIIENDWLDAIVALPDQMFYNTGIFTYIWLVTNRKKPQCRGKVQLIDGTKFFVKMRKSLGNKRNKLGDAADGEPDHIGELARIYGEFRHNRTARLPANGGEKEFVVGKIFDNREFGFAKMVVERPLRLNFQASPERIEKLREEKSFQALAESKKRKDKKAAAREEEEGRQLQEAIIAALRALDGDILYKNRDQFLAVLNKALAKTGLKLAAPLRKVVVAALSDRDETADICRDKDGNPEPDSELRDTENVPLPMDIDLPIRDRDLAKLVEPCEEYLKKEVLPHVPDAWIDHAKTRVGYEIPLNRHFYVYQPPRELGEIEADIKKVEQEILAMLAEVTK
ncbi:MAG: class I SAM-dependent DNA methyltransferase [Thermodesulfobacteriota bacterium]